jgi:2-oxoisovalerate dehydrogenase E2 component (dihydrolipoyl transacylase)
MAEVERIFVLPDLGEGLACGKVIDCRIKVGELVHADQLALVIETAKTCIDLPLPFGGYVVGIHCKVSDIVPVGDPLVTVRTDEMLSTDIDPVNHLVGRRQNSAHLLADRHSGLARRLPPRKGEQHVVISPAVRRLARQLQIDLTTVIGTGKGGMITIDDVKARSKIIR